MFRLTAAGYLRRYAKQCSRVYWSHFSLNSAVICDSMIFVGGVALSNDASVGPGVAPLNGGSSRLTGPAAQ